MALALRTEAFPLTERHPENSSIYSSVYDSSTTKTAVMQLVPKLRVIDYFRTLSYAVL